MGKPKGGHIAFGAESPPWDAGTAVSTTTGCDGWFRLANNSRVLSNFPVNCATSP
ncbi:hypothetical protein A2U01_0104215, partial [Trifolium medium]|nr:hypothetical protein [Trifolium medium]